MFSEKEQQEILKKYTDEMEIIKLRTNQIFTAQKRIEYLEPLVEFKALQLRKVIEQILLASLIANSSIYKQYYNRLGSEWNARLICRDIERINPDFFPKAAINQPDEMKIDDAKESMSSEELIAIYEKMGKLLHSHNPFSDPIDYNSLSSYIDESCKNIIGLLNIHTVKRIGGDAFLFVVMNASNHNGHVAINWFQKCDEEEQMLFFRNNTVSFEHGEEGVTNGKETL